jgi:hypothetical protein
MVRSSSGSTGSMGNCSECAGSVHVSLFRAGSFLSGERKVAFFPDGVNRKETVHSFAQERSTCFDITP